MGPVLQRAQKNRTTLLAKTINLLHQEVFHLVYTRSRLLYAQTKLGTQRRSWVAFPPLHQRARKTDRVIVNKMLLDSFCCIKLSFLWYYGQPGSKIISDLNAHPLQAGKTLPLRSVVSTLPSWSNGPKHARHSLPDLLVAAPRFILLMLFGPYAHITLPETFLSRGTLLPVLLLNPSPMYTLLPVPTRYTTKRDPKHQRCFSEKNMAKRKKKATKNLSSNFEPLVQFTFKNRNLDLPCFGWDGFLPAMSPPAPVGLTRAEAFLLARDVVHFSIKVLEKTAPKTRRSGKVSGSPCITSFTSTSLWHIAADNQESPQILVLVLSPMFICSSPTNPTSNDLYKDDFSRFTPSESLSLSADLAKQGGATVDGWNPAPQRMMIIPLFIGF